MGKIFLIAVAFVSVNFSAIQLSKAERKVNMNQINTFYIKNSEQLYGLSKIKSEEALNGRFVIEDKPKGRQIKAGFKNGYAEGRWEYYENGKLTTKETYFEGRLEKERILYYPDGKTKEITSYKKGKANGNSTDYYPDGKIKSEMTYLNGEKEGEQRNYSETGSLVEETAYEGGEPTGKIKKIIHPGKYDEYSVYMYATNGMEYGPYSERYRNGAVKTKGFYSYGKKDSTWIYYNPYGQNTSMEIYKKGDLAKRILYYSNGKVQTEYEMKNGEKDGLEIRYDDSGNILTEKNYIKGKQVGTQIIYISSTLVDYKKIYNYNEKSIPDGKYSEIYTQSNIPKVYGYYDQGKKTGEWQFYNSLGQKTVVENYMDDKLVSSKILIN